MKNRIFKYTVLFSLLSFLWGCNLLTEDPEVLIKDRINSFESSLNLGAYSDLQKHFHPDMVSYDSYLDTEIFESGSPLNSANSPFYFGSPSISDVSGSDDKLATGAFGHQYIPENDETYSAVMRQDGDKWKILEMVISVSSTDFTIKKLQ